MKTVNMSFEEVQPVYDEIMDFLFNKYGNNPPMDCTFSPEKAALLLGAVKLMERFLMEEIKEMGASVKTILDDHLS